jgi:hypothetical protein
VRRAVRLLAALGTGALLLGPAAARAQRPGDAVPWTLRDSLRQREADFRHPIALPAACPATELWHHLEWEWRRRPRVMVATLWGLSEGEDSASFQRLQRDAAAEPEVARAYAACHAASAAAFWHLVLSASGAERRTLADCREHVDWQRSRYRGSVRNAARWYTGRTSERVPAAHAPYVAFTALLAGQQHNPRTMALYRACYRDDPQALRDYVAEKGR